MNDGSFAASTEFRRLWRILDRAESAPGHVCDTRVVFVNLLKS